LNPIPTRIVIYAKDIMNITGRKERWAYKLMDQIRKKYEKGRGSMISVDEFCEYTGLKIDKVEAFLK
jgi:hypothetical protein